MISVLLTAEGIVIVCMQALTEWQNFKLRNAGIHHNIKVNPNQQDTDPTLQSIEKENDLVQTRVFGLIILALYAVVILYK